MTNIISAIPNMPPVVSTEERGGRYIHNKARVASSVQSVWEEDAAVNVTISNQSRELNEMASINREALACANRLTSVVFDFA